jgi:TP53 regulating kinase-like protein
MEYLGIHSKTVKDFIKEINDLDHPSLTNSLVEKLAKNLAEMHKGDIIHGDLTTSNMMIRPYIPIDKIFQSN